ncbi:hypothetical protein HG535_0F00320 [Zygotorulaspora mrakii]|uniref:C2H2-type domain-containing protein n=1 Tax=Zygotorulaspora mrakii TaxID=42260 RepID=A0A7H9B6V2_ZYGMR|nr:uncharacterized protein HG535_0F00320 [Zygotorulaspora mrakii]QLG73522.1 hypothetical protein HG535_0F00320 [Zygotorulaspora mrakii]
MVTFNCEVCNATVPKKNTEKHYYRCPDAYYTCIDCSKTFEDGVSYKQHTQCISEDQKYQKSLYKGKKPKQKEQAPVKKVEEKEKTGKPTVESKVSKSDSKKSTFPAMKSGESLYKILKTVKDKDTKKKLLKSLVVSEQGSLVLQ